VKPLSIDVVAAQPGFLTVIDFTEDRTVDIGEPVIA